MGSIGQTNGIPNDIVDLTVLGLNSGTSMVRFRRLLV